MPDFRLVSEFAATGDQPAAIEALVNGIEAGMTYQTLLGVTGSGKSVAWNEPVTVSLGDHRIYRGPIGPLIDGIIGRDQFAETVEAVPPADWTIQAWDAGTGRTEWRPITGLSRHESPPNLFRLTTSCGRHVTVTGDHSVWVLRDGELCLTRGSNVQSGDSLPIPLSIASPNVPMSHLNLLELLDPMAPGMSIDIRSFTVSPTVLRETLMPFYPAIDAKLGRIRKGYRGHRVSIAAATALIDKGELFAETLQVSGKRYATPVQVPIRDELAFVFGQYLAEGHGADRFALISTRELEVQTELARCLEQCDIPYYRRTDGDFVIGNRVWRDVLTTLIGRSAGTKRLPRFWPSLSNNHLGMLLRGYFEGDGGVEPGGVIAVTLSDVLAADIAEALLRLGIWARIRRVQKRGPNGKRGTYSQICVSGAEHLTLFSEWIGFASNRKRTALTASIRASANTNVDLVFGVGARLRIERQQRGLFQRDVAKRTGCTRSMISLIETGDRQPSRALFARLCQALNITDPAFVGLANVHWSPVARCDDVPATHQYVYDFSVDGYETFLTGAGGLFVHNTFSMASVIERVNKPTLVLAHNKTLAAQLYAEFKEFFPNNAVEYFVSYYDYYQPEAYVARTDTFIEKDSSINEEIEKLRNAATRSLLTRSDVVIVASVSCIYGLGSPDEYAQFVETIKRGERKKRDRLLHRLVDMQYERNDINFVRGKFRVRGDTLEIFPADDDFAIRVEFWGDEIERIVEVDPLTGEILAQRTSVEIYPAKHFVTTEETMKLAIIDIEAELEDRLKELEANGRLLEAARLRQRTMFDIEMMREAGYCSGIENYSRHLARREAGSTPSCLIDYFPDDFLLFVDESHISLPQVRGMSHGDRSRKEVLVDYGFRLPSALDNRPLNYDEFDAHLNQVVYVSATPAAYELERSQQIVEQVIRPTGLLDPTIEIKPTKGQVDDLLDEVKARVDRRERVLVTTLTKKMAEDLADYLKEMGVKTHYLHSEVQTLERIEILRDLRLGVYDVIVGINLLREGLDLPEVSLVAILDADKEGYLRSETSLIQTIGRAARHIDGHVIMYADNVTGSMQRAIDETYRRRRIQLAYNEEHGITPQGIRKAIRDISDRVRAVAEEKADYSAGTPKALPKDEIARLVKDLEYQMKQAAKDLEFEKAALLRDQVIEFKRLMADERSIVPAV